MIPSGGTKAIAPVRLLQVPPVHLQSKARTRGSVVRDERTRVLAACRSTLKMSAPGPAGHAVTPLRTTVRRLTGAASSISTVDSTWVLRDAKKDPFRIVMPVPD